MNDISMSADMSVELQQVAAFAADLMVCRSQIQIYPTSHPAVTAALDKTIKRLARLLTGGRPLTLGVTRQGLLFKEALIGPNNVKFREYAALLASFGITAISFTEAIHSENILKFNLIINQQRSEIWETGGITHALNIAGVSTIEVQAIDPSIFTLTDELIQNEDGGSADAWEIFVRKLLQGHFSSSPHKILELLAASPARLAAELAAILDGVPEEARQETLKALAECYVEQSLRVKDDTVINDSLDKVSAFISSLDHKVCCDFILNIYNSSNSSTCFIERLLDKLPVYKMQEVAKAVATQGTHVPDMVLMLLQKLASHSESTQEMDAAISEEGVGDKVQVLMRETHLEEYIPQRYLQTLTTILATDKFPDAEFTVLEELRTTLEADQLESKLTDIIDEIVMVIPPEEQCGGIRDNLLSQMDFFLNNRDFRSLAKVCRILGSGYSDDLAAFLNPYFVQRVLTGATLLGRNKYAEIQELIAVVGAPFVDPLIDKLATEENRSLRRFWLDCLSGLGEVVRKAALARLNDEKWFVVRNLLVMLRDFSDAEVVQRVRTLAEHRHPKVRSEALRNLLLYQDPIADRLILMELQHSDPSRKLAAVQIAETSRSKEVMQQLISILETSGITNYQLELKSATVQTLANIGNALALPVLQNILISSPLLHPSKHAQLKIEVIRALPRFRADYVRPVLEKISSMPDDSLAIHAAEALKLLDGAMS